MLLGRARISVDLAFLSVEGQAWGQVRDEAVKGRQAYFLHVDLRETTKEPTNPSCCTEGQAWRQVQHPAVEGRQAYFPHFHGQQWQREGQKQQ